MTLNPFLSFDCVQLSSPITATSPLALHLSKLIRKPRCFALVREAKAPIPSPTQEHAPLNHYNGQASSLSLSSKSILDQVESLPCSPQKALLFE